MSVLNEISENLQRGRAKVVKELVQQALDQGYDAEAVLRDGLMAGMSVVGERFRDGEIFVPEVLVAARAMNTGAAVLKPILVRDGIRPIGRACIGTVQGDMHDIGKNLVRMMLESRGIEVIDLGTDVPPETFIETARTMDCRLICCSALLTTTMGAMAEVVRLAEEAGIRDKVRIMVGGAPVTQAFADQIGADAYTPDAGSAADTAVKLLQEE